MCMLLMSRFQTPTALMLIPVALHPTKRKSDPRLGPNAPTQIAYSPERVSTFVNPPPLLSPPPSGTGPDMIISLPPSYQIFHGSFLQPWLYRSHPALVSFQWNFSMFIYLLDIFMGGSSFCVLLSPP